MFVFRPKRAISTIKFPKRSSPLNLYGLKSCYKQYDFVLIIVYDKTTIRNVIFKHVKSDLEQTWKRSPQCTASLRKLVHTHSEAPVNRSRRQPSWAGQGRAGRVFFWFCERSRPFKIILRESTARLPMHARRDASSKPEPLRDLSTARRRAGTSAPRNVTGYDTR